MRPSSYTVPFLGGLAMGCLQVENVIQNENMETTSVLKVKMVKMLGNPHGKHYVCGWAFGAVIGFDILKKARRGGGGHVRRRQEYLIKTNYFA